jgi:hypothetical protein
MIPAQQADARAPRVSIIGRGINGLLQAVMFRLADYQVSVYGGHQQSDGASHKQVNMRHLSATETTAKPLDNAYLMPGNQYLAVECNRAGIELFEKFLADNPSIDASGDDLGIAHLMDEIEALLRRAGVRFLSQHLSPARIAELSREQFVVTAMEGEEPDGLSIVYCSAYNRIAAGGTYAGGTTQGLVWASLVEEIIQAKAPAVSTMYS